MAGDRTYSTREVAQMWNVSESTVKRWADDSGLQCYRTPGGHRRFRLEDICEFQQRRSFEATGILTTGDWEDPELEVWLNARRFAKVRDLLLYLASHNQRAKVKWLFERLYIRGIRLEDIYEDVLLPLQDMVERAIGDCRLSSGQALLVRNNIEDALLHLSPKMIRRQPNGKTALCAAPTAHSRVAVSIASRLLEIEGWEALNLGDEVSFKIMSEVVSIEPVNLVCVVAGAANATVGWEDSEDLNKVAHSYRIPIILAVQDSSSLESVSNGLAADMKFTDFRIFRKYISRLAG
jgi:excisionase family DNA binding protein